MRANRAWRKEHSREPRWRAEIAVDSYANRFADVIKKRLIKADVGECQKTHIAGREHRFTIKLHPYRCIDDYANVWVQKVFLYQKKTNY